MIYRVMTSFKTLSDNSMDESVVGDSSGRCLPEGVCRIAVARRRRGQGFDCRAAVGQLYVGIDAHGQALIRNKLHHAASF